MSNPLPPRRAPALRVHVQELNQSPTDRYVDILRTRGALLSIGEVDVDVDELVHRRFLCDRHRCIQWGPKREGRDWRALIDNSCCSHYDVPVSKLDRKRVLEILPKVKKRLRKDHPLNQGEELFAIDDEFNQVMSVGEQGTCQFVLYEDGLTTCAIHKTCLEEGLDVATYKPVGCQLWPLAVIDYEGDEGEERYLVTTYTSGTKGLFADAESRQSDDNHFACLVDDDDEYEPLYKSCSEILSHLFGAPFYAELDARATALLANTKE